MSIYDNNQLVHLSDLPSASVVPTKYTINGQQVTEQEYNKFLSDMSTKTKNLKLDDNERNSVSALLADQANKKGLRGQAFSDFVENHVVPNVGARSNTAKNSLKNVSEDKEIIATSTPSQASDIVSVLKQSSEDQAQIMVSLVGGLDHLTTLVHNSNEMKRDQNEILIQQNSNYEILANAMMSQNKILLDTLTSLADSLAFLPKLVESVTIASDRHIEAMNVQNDHLFQKNVNDADYYNDSMHNDNGSSRNLSMLNSNLASIAVTHASIADHQEKQAKNAENKIKDYEDENAPWYKDYLDTAVSAFDTVSDEMSDVDIFTYFMNETTIKEEDIKNGK